jgi:hypothetical protein
MERKGTQKERLRNAQNTDNEIKWGQCSSVPKKVFYREKTKVGNQLQKLSTL